MKIFPRLWLNPSLHRQWPWRSYSMSPNKAPHSLNLTMMSHPKWPWGPSSFVLKLQVVRLVMTFSIALKASSTRFWLCFTFHSTWWLWLHPGTGFPLTSESDPPSDFFPFYSEEIFLCFQTSSFFLLWWVKYEKDPFYGPLIIQESGRLVSWKTRGRSGKVWESTLKPFLK